MQEKAKGGVKIARKWSVLAGSGAMWLKGNGNN